MSSIFQGKPLHGVRQQTTQKPSYDINTELHAQLDDSDTVINVELIQQGKDGASIEFQWRGTELGIRVEGEEEYVYMDLTSGMEIDRETLINTIGFEPAEADLLISHLDDLSIHITPEERKKWNEGVNLDDIYEKLTNLANSTVDLEDYNQHVKDSFQMMEDMNKSLNLATSELSEMIKRLEETKADRDKVLEQLDTKSNIGHRHDDLYASKEALEQAIAEMVASIPSKITDLEDDIGLVTKAYIDSLNLEGVNDKIQLLQESKANLTYVESELSKIYQQIEDLSSNIEIPELDTIKNDIEKLKTGKVDKVLGKDLSTNDFTDELRDKLNSVESGANKYTHPLTHSASMIAETPNKKFVSDFEKEYWGNKANKSDIPTKVSQLVNDEGYITKEDLPEANGNLDELKDRVGALEKGKVNKLEHEIDIKKLQIQIDQIDVPDVDLEPIRTELARLESAKLNTTDFNIAFKALEDKVNAIVVPSKLSELTNDVGFLTSSSETISDIENSITSLGSSKADKAVVSSEVLRLEELINSIEVPDEVDLTPINQAIQELKDNKVSKEEFEQRLDEEIVALIGGAPEALDTLGELAKALGEDANFATTITNMVAEKVSNDKFVAEVARLEERIENLDIPDGVDLTPVYAEINKLKSSKLDISKFNEEMAKVATIEYVVLQLENKADVSALPKNLSELINDTGFITIDDVPKTDLTTIESDIEQLKINKANKSDIPTKLSNLENDTNFITIADIPEVDLEPIKTDIASNAASIEQLTNSKANKADIPTKVGQLVNDKGYITLEQVPETDLSGIDSKITNLENTKADKDAVYNKTDIDEQMSTKANKTDIPSKVSQLENDAKYITNNDITKDIIIGKLGYTPEDEAHAASEIVRLEKTIKDIVTGEGEDKVRIIPYVTDTPVMNELYYKPTEKQPPVSHWRPDDWGIWEVVSQNHLKCKESRTYDSLSTTITGGKGTVDIDIVKNNKDDRHAITLERDGKNIVEIRETTGDQKYTLKVKPGDELTITSLFGGDVYLDYHGENGDLRLYAYKNGVEERIANAELVEKELDNYVTKVEGDSAINNVTDVISAHTKATDNPHKVTKAQLGLSNVDNTSDMDKPISLATQEVLDSKADSGDVYKKDELDKKLNLKADKTSIPTKLSSLENDTDFITLADVPEVDLTDINSKLSNLETSKASKVGLNEHIENVANPHKVTKSQIGLSNVNNTADLDKPISKATQTALNNKADKTAIPTKLSQLENDTGFDVIEDITTRGKYKIIIENGVPYFEEI